MRYLLILIIFLTSCSPQKRAYWHFNQATRLYPQMIGNFDTIVKVTDTTYLKGDTIKTEIKDTVIIKGKVKVVIKDRILTVTTPSDTIIKEIKVLVKGKAYPVFKDKPILKERSFLTSLILGILSLLLIVLLVLSLKLKK